MLRDQMDRGQSPTVGRNQHDESPKSDRGANERESRLKVRVAELEAQVEALKLRRCDDFQGVSAQNGEEEKLPVMNSAVSDGNNAIAISRSYLEDGVKNDGDLQKQIRDLK